MARCVPALQHHPTELVRLVWPQKGKDFLMRRIERRPHVWLHRMPGGVEFLLMTSKSLSNCFLLCWIEIQFTGEMVQSAVA